MFFFNLGIKKHRHLHSFPTRRSSDLVGSRDGADFSPAFVVRSSAVEIDPGGGGALDVVAADAGLVVEDRKSTRLNSSHVEISYAVFCLKKKNTCHID